MHLVYPNSYHIGMSSLGFQTVYALLAAQSDITVERAFVDEDNLRESGAIQTCESGRDLAECDLLAFSVSFETDYLNVVRALLASHLLYCGSAQREEAEKKNNFRMPLIMAGGTAITLNAEPVADFLDLCLLGEAEEFVPEFTAALRRELKETGSKKEMLLKLAQLEGVYVPGFFQPDYLPDGPLRNCGPLPELPAFPRPARRVVKDLSAHEICSAILTPDTEFKEMFLTEVSRGCEMACRFCAASYLYRPVRKRAAEAVLAEVERGIRESRAIGLVGASVSSHPAIKQLMARVASAGARASLSSVMAQRLDDELAESLAANDYESVAIAPETGTERLRYIIGKRVTNETFLEAARRLGRAGLKTLKLYFMLGLPRETEEDVRAILSLSNSLLENFTAAGGKAEKLALSVSAFVPKPGTPFQWEAMEDTESLERKFKWLAREAKSMRKLELRAESPRVSLLQGLLSRGDRRVGKLLVEAVTNKQDWKWLLKRAGGEPIGVFRALDFFTRRKAPCDEYLPWDHLDFRTEKAILVAENRRAHGAADGFGAGAIVES